ncbi:MAG TPA: methionine synthase [Streptosporangiaceae bacterium]|nr:methionine synthase [Streptosporangiaceae bacterium]
MWGHRGIGGVPRPAEGPPELALPWRAGSATGVGSLPGTDPAEAMRVITGELPDLPHLAELPARGPGAGLAGRAAALLVDLPAELTPAGWRFAARPGRDLSRARGMLSSDLDALEEAVPGYQGPLKIQVCGPWTLAASIELARSQDPALADPGAVADLTASLAEGVAGHVAEVRKRVPGAQVLLQLDEPSLPAVLSGGIGTASGLNRLPAPDPADAADRLRVLVAAGPAFTIVHCCARRIPFEIIRRAGAGAAGFDLGQLRREEEDVLAETVEAGLGILAGVVPAMPPATGSAQDAQRPGPAQPPSARAAAERVSVLWRRLGWPAAPGSGGPAGTSEQVVLTPACGLAGASPGYARAALECCREAARLLPELIEEGTG